MSEEENEINLWRRYFLLGIPIILVGVITGVLFNIGFFFLVMAIYVSLAMMVQIKTKDIFLINSGSYYTNKTDSPKYYYFTLIIYAIIVLIGLIGAIAFLMEL